MQKASSWCSKWNPQINLHQQSLKLCNHWVMQKHKSMKCENSNSMIPWRKCEINDSNRLRNIYGWRVKLKNESKSSNHAKCEWNNGVECMWTRKLHKHMNWSNGDGIEFVMVRNAWELSYECAWIYRTQNN